MTQRSDFERIGELVNLCAETMRLVSASQAPDHGPCPFRHIARQLEDLSEEIKDTAAGLPPEWSNGSA